MENLDHDTLMELMEDKSDLRHGSPYDRGSADSYYGRPKEPHYYEGATYDSKKITDLNTKELSEYNKGYDDQEKSGVKKQYY